MKVTVEQIRSEIQKVLLLRDEELQELKDDESLEKYGLNSVLLVQFVVQLERTFGIEVNEEEIDEENFGTITAIANYIHKAKKGS